MSPTFSTLFLSVIVSMTLLTGECSFAESSRIKIGVSTALTGDAAAFGMDIKNSLLLMNDTIGNKKYELIFEDEKCENRDAVSVAQKLTKIDQIKYALGFPCNATLLATASIYERANVVVVTSSANSGDKLDIGKGIYRLFPSDAAGAALLYDYVRTRHKKFGVITEQNEYPIMMQRTVVERNQQSDSPIEVITEEFSFGESDLRTVLLRCKSRGIDAIFVNANTDTSFIDVVRQIRALKFQGTLYSAYLPASATAQKELGPLLEGFIYANLPLVDEMVTEKGREIMAAFRKRFGEPQSGFPVVPTTLEAFRILDLAISSGSDPAKFLATNEFSGGFIPPYRFDEHGAVEGIRFELQTIENGKIKVIQK